MEIELNVLVHNAEIVISRYASKFGHKDSKTGGYLSIKTPGKHSIKLVQLIGQIHENHVDKTQKYKALSQEKADRISVFNNGNQIITSWDSRDPDNQKFGGAVYALPYCDDIISFSGFPELDDELCMFAVIHLSQKGRTGRFLFLDDLRILFSNRFNVPFPELKFQELINS